MKMNKKIWTFIALAVVAVPAAAVAGSEHHEASFADWVMHGIPVLVAGAAVYLGLSAAKVNPGIGDALRMITFGVVAIGLIHVAEILLEVVELFHIEEATLGMAGAHLSHYRAYAYRRRLGTVQTKLGNPDVPYDEETERDAMAKTSSCGSELPSRRAIRPCCGQRARTNNQLAIETGWVSETARQHLQTPGLGEKFEMD